MLDHSICWKRWKNVVEPLEITGPATSWISVFEKGFTIFSTQLEGKLQSASEQRIISPLLFLIPKSIAAFLPIPGLFKILILGFLEKFCFKYLNELSSLWSSIRIISMSKLESRRTSLTKSGRFSISFRIGMSNETELSSWFLEILGYSDFQVRLISQSKRA